MTVGMELLKGTGFDAFKKQITKALTDSTFWEPLPLKLRTHKHKALGFGILSRCWCGVEQSIIDDTQRMPNLIEKLLLDPESAHDIMAVPPCMQTKASKKFLKHWNSIAKLKSRRCRDQLWAKSYLQRRCSIELESKMASIRSLTRQRQQCVEKSFAVLNAEWIISQSKRRPFAASTVHQEHDKSKRRVIRDGPYRGKATGGGSGVQRSATTCENNGSSTDPTRNLRKPKGKTLIGSSL